MTQAELLLTRHRAQRVGDGRATACMVAKDSIAIGLPSSRRSSGPARGQQPLAKGSFTHFNLAVSALWGTRTGLKEAGSACACLQPSLVFEQGKRSDHHALAAVRALMLKLLHGEAVVA